MLLRCCAFFVCHQKNKKWAVFLDPFFPSPLSFPMLFSRLRVFICFIEPQKRTISFFYSLFLLYTNIKSMMFCHNFYNIYFVIEIFDYKFCSDIIDWIYSLWKNTKRKRERERGCVVFIFSFIFIYIYLMNH